MEHGTFRVKQVAMKRPFPLPTVSLIPGLLLLAGCASTYIRPTDADADYERLGTVTRLKAAHPTRPGGWQAAAPGSSFLLELPARFGVARLSGGEVSEVPLAEAMVWEAARERTGGRYGEFFPLNRLVVSTLGTPLDVPQGATPEEMTIDAIRRSALRQELDAVIVYEVRSRLDEATIDQLGRDEHRLFMAATADALLLDVRQATVHATASAQAELEASVHRSGRQAAIRDLAAKTEARAVRRLVGELEAFFRTQSNPR